MRHWIAMDAGATHCVGGLYDGEGRCIAEKEGPACNPTAYGLDASLDALRTTARALLESKPEGAPFGIIAAVAGVDPAKHSQALAAGLCRALGAGEARICGDLQPILAANAPDSPAILAVAGTGSNVLAQDGRGNLLQVGGHGAVLSDDGSAYRIAVDALRAASDAFDKLGPETNLVDLLPRAAGVEGFLGLVGWTATANKAEIAGLSRTVSEAAEAGDGVAFRRIEHHAHRLVAHVQTACRRMQLDKSTPLYIHGGLFANCPLFGRIFREGVASALDAPPRPPALGGHRAVHAVALAETVPDWLTVCRAESGPGAPTPEPVLPETERAALAAPALDSLDSRGIVGALLDAEEATLPALRGEAEAIARAVERLAGVLAEGGRIVYTGAGTSGRLGVLDAAECPPTFGVAAGRVSAVIAGGEPALRESVEGAEDDTARGRTDLEALGIGPGDAVVGIAASGLTPYTRAALDFAAERGAATVLLCCNPQVRTGAEIVIACPTGPEALPGSTRLKAGTATKMVLNVLSTGAMTLGGLVFEGRMVGMRPVNAKLRDRAVRMVSELSTKSAAEARPALQSCGWNIRQAVLMLRAGVAPQEAAAMLQSTNGHLGRALIEAGAALPGRAYAPSPEESGR